MKKIQFVVIAIFACLLSMNAQDGNFKQDFETLEKGKDITKLQKKKFSAWGEAKFTVTEKKGKGNNGSDKFASSDGAVNATLVLYKDLEVGATYVFSVAVKMTNVQGKAAKANYAVKATSGKKGDIHGYGQDKLVAPKANKWKEHKLEFTVIEGREKVTLTVYRWAKDVTLNVDYFELIKK